MESTGLLMLEGWRQMLGLPSLPEKYLRQILWSRKVADMKFDVKFHDRGKVADMKFDVKFRDLGESREIFHKMWRQYLGLVCPSRATIRDRL